MDADLLSNVLRWLPMHAGKFHLLESSIDGTLWWMSPIFLTGLISCYISFPQYAFLGLLVFPYFLPKSFLLPRISLPQASSYSTPTLPLIHWENVYLFFIIIPYSLLVEWVLPSAVWGLWCIQIAVINTLLLRFSVQRQHSSYSELDLTSRSKFSLISFAFQDSLLNQKLGIFYGIYVRNGKMYSSLSLRRNKNLFPSFPLCMGYPLLSHVDRDPEWGDLGLQHHFPKQPLLQHRELLWGL